MGGLIGKKKPKFDPMVLDIRHFSQERCIGAGGFGKVHACFKQSPPETGKLFAMKTLDKKNIFKNKNGVCEVMDEMHLLSSIIHPFVCNIYYAFQDPWSLYLVMDLAKGGDLRYRMKQWKLDKKLKQNPEEHVKFFISNIILALEYLHEQHVMHRDLKPENYILEESGYTLLTDFGIADALDPEVNVCTKSSGTNGYMAPEVYHQSREHTYTADFFSLGVSLFELLESKRPFTKDFLVGKTKSLKSWTEEGRNDEKRDHSGLKMTCSEEAKDFVVSLLQFNPFNRLGAKGISEIKSHKWFDGFNWEDTASKKVTPPFMPDCRNANCDSADLDMAEMFVDTQRPPPPREEQQKLLADYHFSHLGTHDDGSSIATLAEGQNSPSFCVRENAAKQRKHIIGRYKVESKKDLIPDQDESGNGAHAKNTAGNEEHEETKGPVAENE